jgi:MFS family permease
MPWGVINIFMADYLLVDRKAHSSFLSDKLAAWTVCGAFGIGSLAGSIIGGEVGSRIYLWKRTWIAYLLGICQILAIVPQVLVLNLPFHLETLVPINFIGGILISISRPNLQTIVLNINAPNIHGTASAWWSIFGDISAGIGPPLVALLVVAYGRQMAFSISFAMWLLNALVTFLLSFTLVADEDRVVSQVFRQQILSRQDADSVETGGTMVHE